MLKKPINYYKKQEKLLKQANQALSDLYTEASLELWGYKPKKSPKKLRNYKCKGE